MQPVDWHLAQNTAIDHGEDLVLAAEIGSTCKNIKSLSVFKLPHFF